VAGVNATLTEHWLPGVRDAPQPFIGKEKLVLTDIVPSAIAPALLLASMTVWDGLVPPMASVPKLNGPGAI
jgi:hypothetical protein